MKICVGLKDSKRMEEYIRAGAKEFYCGVIDSVWLKQFGFVIGLNRRPWPSSNMSSFEELKQVVKKAHLHECKVFFTINEHCYTNAQLELVDYYVQNALDSGVDAIILADSGLIHYFYEKYQCNIHLSTGGTVFNKWTAEFFRDELKVSRIILPREVTLKEIEDITQIDKVEYEVFILNEGCINIDGFCNHSHGIHYVGQDGQIKNGDYSVGCMLRYDLLEGTIKGEKVEKDRDICSELNESVTRCGSCGACAIYNFQRYGVDSLKLVGRVSDKDKIIRDIQFIKYTVDLASQVDDFQEFSHKVKEYKGDRTAKRCKQMCYYPEILKE